MKNEKHTPGAWTVNPVNPHCIQIRAKKISNPKFECSVAILGGWDTTAEENEGNASLIAAAPSMLEALEMVSNFNWKNNRTHLLEIVNAAIAQAKGE